MSLPIAVGWKALPTYALAEAGVERNGEGLVYVPYRLAAGGLYAERVIAPSGRRWWRPGDGRPVIPFGLDRIEDEDFRKYRVLAICEGESDALALSAALGAEGFDVLGVPGASTWRSEWACHIQGYAAVFVLGDGDAAGHRFNMRVRLDLPEALTVWLPDEEDVRSLVQRDPAELVGLIAEAEQAEAFFSASMTEAAA